MLTGFLKASGMLILAIVYGKSNKDTSKMLGAMILLSLANVWWLFCVVLLFSGTSNVPLCLLISIGYPLAIAIWAIIERKNAPLNEGKDISFDWTWFCPKCGTTNNGSMGYCGGCKTSIEDAMKMDWSCPSCGTSNTKYANICTKCGFSRKSTPITTKNSPTAMKNEEEVIDFDNTSHIFYCRNCNSTYSGYKNDSLSKRCPDCKKDLLETTILTDTWKKYSAEEKAEKKADFFSGNFLKKDGEKHFNNIKFSGLTKKEKKSSDVIESVPDEIKKYKELLDNGAITQEEYDAKKKQLLNL